MKKLQCRGIALHNDQFFDLTSGLTCNTKGFYFFSNDVVQYKQKAIVNSSAFIGIGNPHFLHVLYLSSLKKDIKRVIAIDYSGRQLEHLYHIVSVILNSNSRIDFVEKLLKLKLNSVAKGLLENFSIKKMNYIHGAVKKDKYFNIEFKLWENVKIDKKAFFESYGLEVTETEKGILINSETIGDINEYYLTLFSGSLKNYDRTPFTMAYGSGYLKSDEDFMRLKFLLGNVPFYFIQSDICESLSCILEGNRYLNCQVWLSNVFIEYFIKKHPGLMQTRIELQNYLTNNGRLEWDLNIIQDEREKKDFIIKKCKYSVHYKTFHELIDIIGDNNLEVVSEKRWIDEDDGESKLPNTEYSFIDDFILMNSKETIYDSIILHILIGHGINLDKFDICYKKAKELANNVIILEHNINSNDFRKEKNGDSVEHIRTLYGYEKLLRFCPGEKCGDRNFIMVY